MASDKLIKLILANLSAEGIDRQIKHEFRQGYPKATEAEIQMLFDANKKAGSPPRSLEHAKRILADNIWCFQPSHGSPFDKASNTWHAMKHWPKHLPPTAADFDNAARAVWRAHLAHQAATSLPIPDDETPPTAPL
jgi:hypothetical protein